MRPFVRPRQVIHRTAAIQVSVVDRWPATGDWPKFRPWISVSLFQSLTERPILLIFLKFWKCRGMGEGRVQIFYWISWRFTQIWVESKKFFFENFSQDFIYRRTLLDVFLSVFMTTVNRRPRLYSRKKAWPISVIFRWPSTTLLRMN